MNVLLTRLKSQHIGPKTRCENGWIFSKSNTSTIFALPTTYWNGVQIYYSSFIPNSPGPVQLSAVTVHQVSQGCLGTTEHVGTRATGGPWDHPGKRELVALTVPKVEKVSRPRPLRGTGNNVLGKMSMMGETMG